MSWGDVNFDVDLLVVQLGSPEIEEILWQVLVIDSDYVLFRLSWTDTEWQKIYLAEDPPLLPVRTVNSSLSWGSSELQIYLLVMMEAPYSIILMFIRNIISLFCRKNTHTTTKHSDQTNAFGIIHMLLF